MHYPTEVFPCMWASFESMPCCQITSKQIKLGSGSGPRAVFWSTSFLQFPCSLWPSSFCFVLLLCDMSSLEQFGPLPLDFTSAGSDSNSQIHPFLLQMQMTWEKSTVHGCGGVVEGGGCIRQEMLWSEWAKAGPGNPVLHRTSPSPLSILGGWTGAKVNGASNGMIKCL